MECQHPLSLHYLSVNQSPAGQVENESVIARAMYAVNFVFHTPTVTCPVGCKLVLQIFRQRGLYSDRGAIFRQLCRLERQLVSSRNSEYSYWTQH